MKKKREASEKAAKKWREEWISTTNFCRTSIWRYTVEILSDPIKSDFPFWISTRTGSYWFQKKRRYIWEILRVFDWKYLISEYRGFRFNQNIWILQLQIFSRKIICPIRLFKTKIFKFNCITEMFILKIFLFFFSTSLFKNLKIPFLIDQHCLENLFRVSGGIRCSISNRSQEDESEERREIELLPCGFDQTYVG